MIILGFIITKDTRRYCVSKYRNAVIIKNMILFYHNEDKSSWIPLQDRFHKGHKGIMGNSLYAPEYITI